MELVRIEERGVIVLKLSGKILGGKKSASLADEIDRFVEAKGKSLLFDLDEVPWMNSSGLGIFLAAFIRIREGGGTMKFVHVQDRVRGILVTTKLIDILEVFEDETEAIKSFHHTKSGETA